MSGTTQKNQLTDNGVRIASVYTVSSLSGIESGFCVVRAIAIDTPVINTAIV